MNNEKMLSELDCLKNTSLEINKNFCTFKAVKLMEYEQIHSNEIKFNNFKNDIKLIEEKKKDQNQNNLSFLKNKFNNNLDIDNKLKSNIILCNSSNIFNEICEDELVFLNELPVNQTSIDKSKDNLNELNNKDLIDKNVLSLATQKLVKNINKQNSLINKPLMIVDYEELNQKIETNENKKLIEQFSLETNKENNEQEAIKILNDQVEQKKIDKNIDNQNILVNLNSKLIEEDKKDFNESLNFEKNEDINLNDSTEAKNENNNLNVVENILLNEEQIEKEKKIFQLKKATISKDILIDTVSNDDKVKIESSNASELSSSSSNDQKINTEQNEAIENEEVFFYDDEETNFSDESYLDRLKRLEEEQDQLNGSLIALTSHFAQVQLRLKQIVDASPENKENLLKDLKEFAFRGIPDQRLPDFDDFNNYLNEFNSSNDNNEENPMKKNKIQIQRDKQKELIFKLKEQLEDLEKYAYETGDLSVIPSSMIMERQNVIIEELKEKLPLDLDQLEKMSPEELRKQIDKAIRELVNPVVLKEQLVDQLKTQVTDLERFIEFLQEGKICFKSNKAKNSFFKNNHGFKVDKIIANCKCNCSSDCQQNIKNEKKETSKNTKKLENNKQDKNCSDDLKNNEKVDKMIKRALALLQMFTFVHFGCNTKTVVNKANKFERNILKKNKINHWGDLRAKLEISIDKLIELKNQENDCSDIDENFITEPNERITSFVRKQLCVLLRNLLEHGLNGSMNGCVSNDDRVITNENLFSSWNCFSQKSNLINLNDRPITVWDILLNYFYLKKGDQFRQTPARKLSLSFNLDIVGGVPITPKQTLLSCLDEIMETHTKLKRSADSHFKAFISYALNEKRLVCWLKLIFKCKTILTRFYEPWSYVNSNAFDEGIRSLDRLTKLEFNLPTDIAIRQLQNINDAF